MSLLCFLYFPFISVFFTCFYTQIATLIFLHCFLSSVSLDEVSAFLSPQFLETFIFSPVLGSSDFSFRRLQSFTRSRLLLSLVCGIPIIRPLSFYVPFRRKFHLSWRHRGFFYVLCDRMFPISLPLSPASLPISSIPFFFFPDMIRRPVICSSYPAQFSRLTRSCRQFDPSPSIPPKPIFLLMTAWQHRVRCV